jgi:5-methylthioribose kinase
MRKLNYEHIFEYPFREENGFDLDTVQEGLQAVAMYKKT